MWVRKTNQHNTSKCGRLWLSFRGPVLWFLVTFAGGILLALRGPYLAVTHWPSTWPEVISSATSFAAVFAIGSYALQILLKRRLVPFAVECDVVMCDTCHRVKQRDRETTCECGGKFDDFDNWTWIEESQEEANGDAASREERMG
jgi:hypothetical protein